jgi:hypothetical protein
LVFLPLPALRRRQDHTIATWTLMPRRGVRVRMGDSSGFRPGEEVNYSDAFYGWTR